MILLGLGFIPLVIGASYIDIDPNYKASMIFLTLAYLIHTTGELCLSPVGLSYVNKLSPKRFLGILFGIWFFASAIGNKFAGCYLVIWKKFKIIPHYLISLTYWYTFH